MSDPVVQQPAKPGTACLGCRRRKLKCSREPGGCSNCSKLDLPCVYPAPETGGVKRKRGPYRKDKPARERHLEDLVKYLEPTAVEGDGNSATGEPSGEANLRSSRTSDGLNASRQVSLEIGSKGKGSNSEDLVKDALVALTRPHTTDSESVTESTTPVSRVQTKALHEIGAVGLHPSIGRIFEYWHLFVFRFDPLTKVIHCPTFVTSIISSIDDLRGIGPSKEALLFSIYYAAVSTCTAWEAQQKFGDSREALLQRYSRSVEASLAENYSVPELESLQAIIIYMIAVRREDNTTNMRALFSLAVRTAQMMGLGDDPGENYSPFEAEMRRRLWWHICALESRGAEEGGARSHSIMEDRNVELPTNYFDSDLFPGTERWPQPRTGCTDMTFLLLRLDTIRTVHRLWKIRKMQTNKTNGGLGLDVKTEQRRALEEFKTRLETHYLRYLDESRPYDWLCINFAQLMLIKTRLIIDHPFGQVPTKQMGPPERLDLLQSSVSIIGLTHAIEGIKGAEQWLWYYRGWNQWHAAAIVISYLGWSTNKPFVDHAWSTLDPMLARWDKVYSLKRDEPAWDHVNALIERARQMRRKNFPTDPTVPSSDKAKTLQHSGSAQEEMAAETLQNGVSSTPLSGPTGALHDPGTKQHHEISNESFFTPTNQPKLDVPFHTGCAPVMPGLEEDFGSFHSLDNIDFSAFDAVFGDTSWEFSAPNSDWSTGTLGL